MKKLLLSFFLIMFISACTSEKEKSEQGVYAKNKAELLAEQYCTSCHKLPEPDKLDKASWREFVLPRMGYFMGIYPNDTIRESLIEQGPGGELIRKANVFPQSPTIPLDAWEKIQEYYLMNAPEKPIPAPVKEIKINLKQFKVNIPAYRLKPPSTTLVKFLGNEIYVGDANTQSLLHFNSQMELQKAGKVREGAVWLNDFGKSFLVTVMGSFSPTDDPSGFIMNLPKDGSARPIVLIKNLRRPVHTEVSDLDADGIADIIVSEFGKWTGGLSWYKWTGDDKNPVYQKNVLRDKPGAIKSYVRDLNGDALPDIISLFGQGDEGIFAYFNQGRGKFEEKRLLQFYSSWGSSFFNLHDFNGDGHLDILYLAGDNADFRPILKHYHGIRIYINDGNFNFKEKFFYHLNGAYNAIPEDYDGDGDLDIAAISFFPDFYGQPEESFVYLENKGDFIFEASTFEDPTMGRWVVMDSGDIDKDGDIDLILGSLAFEVVPKGNFVERWANEGIPFIILENNKD